MADKKIYFNNKVITITKSTKSFTDKIADIKVAKFKQESVVSILNNFLINPSTKEVIIRSKSPKKVLKVIKSHFYYIEAAGGIVKANNKILLIKRFNNWDLPKGKVEKKEKLKKAAIREIKEETGVFISEIRKKTRSTNHIYPYKNGFAFKKTHWYLMGGKAKQKLRPQKDEQITEAKWVKSSKAKILLNESYASFQELIDKI